MRKIVLSSYPVKVKVDNKEEELPYEMRNSLVNVLFHPALKLAGRALLLHHKLAEKIESCNKDSILLEDSEYMLLKNAVEKIPGFTKNDVTFVKRVLEAEEVEVKEAKQ